MKLPLIINDIQNLVSGNIVSGQVSPEMQAAADHYRQLQYTSHAALAVVVMAIAIFGLVFVRQRIKTKMRARNHVERLVLWILVACSTVAIFISIGIVLSVLYMSEYANTKVRLNVIALQVVRKYREQYE